MDSWDGSWRLKSQAYIFLYFEMSCLASNLLDRGAEVTFQTRMFFSGATTEGLTGGGGVRAMLRRRRLRQLLDFDADSRCDGRSTG